MSGHLLSRRLHTHSSTLKTRAHVGIGKLHFAWETIKNQSYHILVERPKNPEIKMMMMMVFWMNPFSLTSHMRWEFESSCGGGAMMTIEWAVKEQVWERRDVWFALLNDFYDFQKSRSPLTENIQICSRLRRAAENDSQITEKSVTCLHAVSTIVLIKKELWTSHLTYVDSMFRILTSVTWSTTSWWNGFPLSFDSCYFVILLWLRRSTTFIYQSRSFSV